jgi:hypothetical protein
MEMVSKIIKIDGQDEGDVSIMSHTNHVSPQKQATLIREWPKSTGKSPGQPGGEALSFFTPVVGGRGDNDFF